MITPTESLSKAKWWVFMWLAMLFAVAQATFRINCESERICDLSSISVPALSEFSADPEADRKLYASISVSVGALYIGRKQALRFTSGSALPGSQSYTFYGSYDNVKTALRSLTYKPNADSLQNTDALQIQVFKTEDAKASAPVLALPIAIEIYPRYKISTPAVPDGYLDIDEGNALHVPVTLTIPNVPKSSVELVSAEFEVQSGVLNLGASCQKSKLCTFDGLSLTRVAALLEGLQYVAPMGLNGIMIIDPLKIILRSKTRMYTTDMAFYLRVMPATEQLSVDVQKVILASSSQLFPVHDYIQIQGRSDINCQLTVEVNNSMLALLSISQAKFYTQYFYEPRTDLTMNKAKKSLSIFGRLGALKDMIRSLYYIPPQEQKTLVTDGLSVQLSGCIGADGMPRTEIYLDTGRIVVEYAPVPPKLSLNTSVATSLILYGHENESKNLSLVTLTHYGDYAPVTAVLVSLTAMDGGLFDISDVLAEKVLHNDVRVLNHVNGSVVLLTTLQEFNSVVPMISYVPPAHTNALSRELQHLDSALPFTIEASLYDSVLQKPMDVSLGTLAFQYYLLPTNDAPVLMVPTNMSVLSILEDTTIALSGIHISDVDQLSTPQDEYRLTIRVKFGKVRVVALDNKDEDWRPFYSLLTLTGTLDSVNARLQQLTYQPRMNFHGEDILTFTLVDQGLQVKESITVNIDAVNDPPILTLEGDAGLLLQQNTNVTIHGVSVKDMDFEFSPSPNALLEVLLETQHGRMGIINDDQIRYEPVVRAMVGPSQQSNIVLFQGTYDSIHHALQSMVYTPPKNFYGVDTLTLTVSDLGYDGIVVNQTDGTVLKKYPLQDQLTMALFVNQTQPDRLYFESVDEMASSSMTQKNPYKTLEKTQKKFVPTMSTPVTATAAMVPSLFVSSFTPAILGDMVVVNAEAAMSSTKVQLAFHCEANCRFAVTNRTAMVEDCLIPSRSVMVSTLHNHSFVQLDTTVQMVSCALDYLSVTFTTVEDSEVEVTAVIKLRADEAVAKMMNPPLYVYDQSLIAYVTGRVQRPTLQLPSIVYYEKAAETTATLSIPPLANLSSSRLKFTYDAHIANRSCYLEVAWQQASRVSVQLADTLLSDCDQTDSTGHVLCRIQASRSCQAIPATLRELMMTGLPVSSLTHGGVWFNVSVSLPTTLDVRSTVFETVSTELTLIAKVHKTDTVTMQTERNHLPVLRNETTSLAGVITIQDNTLVPKEYTLAINVVDGTLSFVEEYPVRAPTVQWTLDQKQVVVMGTPAIIASALKYMVYHPASLAVGTWTQNEWLAQEPSIDTVLFTISSAHAGDAQLASAVVSVVIEPVMPELRTWSCGEIRLSSALSVVNEKDFLPARLFDFSFNASDLSLRMPQRITLNVSQGVLVDNQGRNGSVLSFTTLTALEVDTVLRSTGYKAPSFPSARNPVTGDVVTLSLVLEWDQDDTIFAPAGVCDRQFVFFVQNHDDPPSWTVSTLSPLSFGALRNEPIALGSTFQATDEDSSIVSATLSYTCERPTCTGTGEWMISALSGASVQEKTNTSLSVFGSIEKVNAFLRAVRLHFPAGTNDRVTMVGTVRDQSSVSETLTLTGRIRMDNSTLSLSRRPVALSDVVFARNVSMATLVAVDCNDCGDVQAMVGLPDEGGHGGLSWDFSSMSSAWQRVNASHVSVAAKDVELPAQFAALRLIVDDRVSGVAVVRVTIVSPISESLPVSLFFLAPMSTMDETPPVGQPSAVEPSWAQQSTASSPSLRFSTKTTLCMEDDVDGCTLPSLSVHNLSLVENCQDGFVRLQTNYGGFGATNASAFNVVLPSLVNGSHDIDLGDVVMTLPSHFNGIWPGSIAKDHALSQFVVPVDSLDRLITVSASLFCTGQKAIATITHRVSVVPMNDAPLVEVPMWNAVRNISEGYSARPFVGSRLADVDAVALPSWMKQRFCQRFTLSVSSSVGELEAPTASLVKAGIVVRVGRDATVGATVALQGSLSALSSVLNEMTLLIPPQEATASMASPLQTVTVTVADGGCFGFGGTQTTTKTFSFAVVASNQRRALELMAYPVDSSDDTTYVSLTSAFSVAPVNVAVNDTQVFARVSTDYNLDIALPLASNEHVVVPARVFTYAVPQVLAPAPTVHRLLMDVPWRVNVQRIVIAFPVNAKGEYAYPLQETIELTMGTDKVATSTGSDIAAVVENVYQAVNSWKALGRISVQYVPPTDVTVVTSVAMDIVFHDYAGALSMIQATSSWNGTVTVTGVQVGTMQPEIQTLTLRVPTNNVNGTFVVVVTYDTDLALRAKGDVAADSHNFVSAELSFNASAEEVATALNAIPKVGTVLVTKTITSDPHAFQTYQWTVTFLSFGRNVPLLKMMTSTAGSTVPFFYYLTTCTYCTPFWNATGLEVTVTEVQNATDTLRGVMRVGARVATDPTGAYRFVSSPIAVDADARTMKLALSTFSAAKTVHVQRLTCSYELACHYELVVQYDNSFHGETASIEALLNYGGVESVFGSDLLPTSFVLQSGRPLRRFTYDLGVVTSVSTSYARVTTAEASGNLAAQLNTLLAGSGYEAVVSSTSTDSDETVVKVVLQAVDVSLIEEELMYDQIPSLVIKASLPMKEETLDSEEEAVSFVVEELSAVGSTGSYDRFLLTVQRPTLPVIAEQQVTYCTVTASAAKSLPSDGIYGSLSSDEVFTMTFRGEDSRETWMFAPVLSASLPACEAVAYEGLPCRGDGRSFDAVLQSMETTGNVTVTTNSTTGRLCPDASLFASSSGNTSSVSSATFATTVFFQRVVNASALNPWKVQSGSDGDVPLLSTNSASSSLFNMSVEEAVKGLAPAVAEVQSITLISGNTTVNDAASLTGFYVLEYGRRSELVSLAFTTEQLKDAISALTLVPAAHIAVSQRVLPADTLSVEWRVTFAPEVGRMLLLRVDSTCAKDQLQANSNNQTGYSVVDPLGSSRDYWRGQSCLIAGDANPTFVVRRIVSGYSSLQGYLELSSESASVQVSIHSLTAHTLQAQVTELLQLSGFPRASAVVTVGKPSGTHAAAFIVDLINGTLPFLNVGTDGISVNYLRCGYPHLAGDEQQPGASSVVNVASPETSCVFPFYGGASSQANVPYSDCIPGLTTSGSGQKTCAVLLSTSNPTGSGYCADCRHPLTTDANWAFRATWTPIVSSLVLKGTVQELMTTFLPSLHVVPRRVLNNVYFGQSVKGQVRLATRLVGPTAMVQSPVSVTSVVSMALSRHVTLSAQNQEDSSSGMFYTWEDTSLVLRDVFVVSEDVPSDVESFYEVHVESTIGSLTFKDAAQVFASYLQSLRGVWGR